MAHTQQKLTQLTPPPPPGLLYKFEYEGKTKEGDHLIGGHLVEVQPYEDLRDGCMHLQIHYDHLAGIWLPGGDGAGVPLGILVDPVCLPTIFFCMIMTTVIVNCYW